MIIGEERTSTKVVTPFLHVREGEVRVSAKILAGEDAQIELGMHETASGGFVTGGNYVFMEPARSSIELRSRGRVLVHDQATFSGMVRWGSWGQP